MTEPKLVYNAIRTPDGTLLESFHRHDYKEHEDTISKELYINDGGISYTRRSINKVPATDLTLTDQNDISEIREFFKWGTYGKGGRDPFKRVPLKDLTNPHISAILETQFQLPEHIRGVFQRELDYRSDKGLEIYEESC